MKTMNNSSIVHLGVQKCAVYGSRFSGWKLQGLLLRLHAAKGLISLFVAFSTLTGYVLKAGRLDVAAAHIFFAILLLAAGSATLNNLQDRKLDRRFTRTSGRPLACGSLSASQGKRQTLFLLAMGSLLLYLSPHGSLLLFLGLTAVACYNLLYTPYKFRTLWAIAPGVICGMIPPLMGWVAAGGQLWSPRIWLIMILLGLWQPPHAWLIMLSNTDELRADGSRNILSIFSTFQVNRILFVWVCSFIAVLVLLPLFGILRFSIFSTSLVLAGGLVAGCYAWGLFVSRTRKTYKHLFTLLNSILALTMLYCILDNLLPTTI